ncbi:IS110 family transposase, partial [Gordonia terrae]
MTETAVGTQVVVLGVDTHQQTHHAAIIDTLGLPLADLEFPASAAGYQQLLDWARTHGRLEQAGVESSASYGAGLTRELTAAGIEVIEVNAPDVRARRAQGKSDQLDA